MTALQQQLKQRMAIAVHNGRVDWVDYSKGICIFFVVMMHATLGVEKAAGADGWMHFLTSFAKPFRMPDFFMLSGLFLALTIDKPWIRYFDRKILHFAYFYLLWVTLILGLKAPEWLNGPEGLAGFFRFYAYSMVEPYGTLWFIYLLPVFFLTARLMKNLPVWLTLGSAALLQILPIHVGSVVIDEFSERYVYFLIGYLFAPRIFDLASWVRNNPGKASALFSGWIILNAAIVFAPLDFLPQGLIGIYHVEHLSDLPLVSLALGIMGALAIVTAAVLLTRFSWTGFLAYMGANSIVVYLAFTFPNSITRAILLSHAPELGIGNISLIVTLVSLVTPLIGYRIIQRLGFGMFLFKRPLWAHIDRSDRVAKSWSTAPGPAE